MNRIYNNPDYMVEDMTKGFLKANKDLIAETENPQVVKYKKAPVPNKVGIVTGGGSGHKPAFIGYVGENLCDAAAIGQIFSSPTAKAFLDAIKAADSGKGVACLYGNYAGDNMNVKMAVKKAKKAGIEVKTVVANDDCASAPKTELEKRRGVAGEVLMWKIGGAKASMGANLDEVIAAAQKAINNTRSIGIGTAPCTIPAVGHPNFQIEDGKMEFGSPSRFLRDIDVHYLQLPHEAGVSRAVDEGAGRFRASLQQRPKAQIIAPSVPRNLKKVSTVSPSNGAQATSSTSASVAGVQAGQMIEHERFGLGEVIKVEGTGDNAKATIHFKNAGDKQLLLRFARFKVVE